MIGERGITLSGGQRQRVAIARALVVDPRILILDDATASVDATTESKIRDGLREAMRGRTTIIIAHRLSTIALADEIVVLDDGRIVFHGSQDDARDERRLPRDRGARDARADLRRGRRMRVHQPGSHLMRGGRPQVDDWSWAQTKRRLATLYRLARPYKRADAARDRLAARRDGRRRSRRRTSSAARSTRSGHGATGDLGWLVALFLVAGGSRSAFTYGQTYFTGWTGERMLADLRNHALPPPAAALARLLRAQPRGRDHQPPHERRRGARPARHRRRHVARPEHADARRLRGRPLLPRLAARARDAHDRARR